MNLVVHPFIADMRRGGESGGEKLPGSAAAAVPGRSCFSRDWFSGKDLRCWWHRPRSRHSVQP
jgi:hypothetical protein